MKISQRTISGTPDILLCVNGRFVAVELKASDTYGVTNLQAYQLKAIRNAFGRSYVCYPENMNEVLEELDMISKGYFLGEIS